MRLEHAFGAQSTYWYLTDYDLFNRPTNAVDSVSLAREECACREAIRSPERSEPAGPQGAALYNRRSERVQRDIYAESKGFSRRERKGRKAHAAQATCLRSLTR